MESQLHLLQRHLLLRSSSKALKLRDPYGLTFLVVVCVSAWFGGEGPGYLGLVLGAVGVMDVLHAEGSWQLLLRHDIAVYGAFFLLAFLILRFSKGRRRVEASLTRSRDLLEAQVQARTIDLTSVNAELLDMVRYESFDHASRWRHEYGSVDNAEDFYSLHAYSPYHHIEEGVDYPSVLFISGDRDARCNPAHVRKMAARLQGRNAQTRPILVDYMSDRGHSPVLPLSVRVESLTRRITFLCRALNIKMNRNF